METKHRMPRGLTALNLEKVHTYARQLKDGQPLTPEDEKKKGIKEALLKAKEARATVKRMRAAPLPTLVAASAPEEQDVGCEHGGTTCRTCHEERLVRCWRDAFIGPARVHGHRPTRKNKRSNKPSSL